MPGPRFVACVSALICTPSLVGAGPITFTEVTEEAGLDTRYEVTQLPTGTIAYMMAGGAIADFNNDGWEDIFVLAGDRSHDCLYINNRDGTFTESAQAWGVDATHVGGGAIAGDYNSDGFIDIFVTSCGPSNGAMQLAHHKLYRNNGDGTFTDVADEAGVRSVGAAQPDGFSPCFGDPDLDGDLDLVVSLWRGNNHGFTFFRNQGDGTFERETRCFIGGTQFVRSFTPSFADMDGDRYPELLIAADFGTSAYFRNNADGSFTRLFRNSVGLVDTNGMGAVVADISGDGLLDWFVSNICCAGEPDDWEGQNLFLNRGGHLFEDYAHKFGVVDAVWAWGADACDLDNDTDLDLVVVNGWGTNPMRNRLFESFAGDSYVETGQLSGFDSTELSRGVASLDYDRDGDLDLVVFNHDGPVQLYRNDTANANASIRIELDTSMRPDLAPNGFGAWLDIEIAGRTHRRYIDGAPNFLVNSSIVEHVGLGEAPFASRLVVTWQDGAQSVRTRVQDGTTLRVMAPPTCAYPDTTGDGLPDFGDFDATNDGMIDFEDLYLASAGAHDANQDGLTDAGDARCVRDYLRIAERLDTR